MSLFIDVVRLPHSAGLPLPDYATDGAAAVDLIAAIPEDAPVKRLIPLVQVTPICGARHANESLRGHSIW